MEPTELYIMTNGVYSKSTSLLTIPRGSDGHVLHCHVSAFVATPALTDSVITPLSSGKHRYMSHFRVANGRKVSNIESLTSLKAFVHLHRRYSSQI